MAKTTIVCPQCFNKFDKENGSLNRSRKTNRPVFCGRACSGKSKRNERSLEQKAADKREYDLRYRAANKEMLKTKKAAYFKRAYNPNIARIERKKRAHYHADYCRTTAYREWKRKYDKKYQAIKRYGEYWECFILTLDIRNECTKQLSDYEIRKANETLNKAQWRKRNVR